MIKQQQILPAVSTLLNLATCVVYGYHGDIRQALYWFFCAVITVVVAY